MAPNILRLVLCLDKVAHMYTSRVTSTNKRTPSESKRHRKPIGTHLVLEFMEQVLQKFFLVVLFYNIFIFIFRLVDARIAIRRWKNDRWQQKLLAFNDNVSRWAMKNSTTYKTLCNLRFFSWGRVVNEQGISFQCTDFDSG